MYSGLKSLFFLFFCLICWANARNLEDEVCTLCTLVEDTIERIVDDSVKKLDLGQLEILSEKICLNILNKETKEQCFSFISLFGPKIIEAIISKMDPKKICSTLEVCESDSPHYKIILPTIRNDSLVYITKESEIKQETKFYYKIYLPNETFLSNHTSSLLVFVEDVEDAEVSIKVTDKSTRVSTDSCKPGTICNVGILYPGKMVWFYFDLEVKPNEDASFKLRAVAQNSIKGFWKLRIDHLSSAEIWILISLGFMVLCTILLGVSRCVLRRSSQQLHFEKPDVEQPILVFLDNPTISLANQLQRYQQFK